MCLIIDLFFTGEGATDDEKALEAWLSSPLLKNGLETRHLLKLYDDLVIAGRCFSMVCARRNEVFASDRLPR